MLRSEFVFVIFVITSLVAVCNSEVIKNEWVKPDIFSRKKSQYLKQTITSSPEIEEETRIAEACDSCPVPVCPEPNVEPAICMKPDDDVATFLYKRLVSSLIMRENVPSKSSTKIIKFTVTEKHLRILESSSNIRDWDGVLGEIIARIEDIDPVTNHIYKASSNFSFGNLRLSIVASFLSKSEVQFTLFVILFLSLGFYVKRNYKYGWICIIFVTMFSSGYIYTYYECNRQLEVNELVNMMHTEENPCEKVGKPLSYKDYFLRMFSNPKEECEQYLRKKHQIQITFCRPDDVFVKYMNNMIFNQIEIIVKKSIDIFRRCSREVPFPYNIVAMLALPFLLIAILKLGFQYYLSPSAWFQYYRIHRETQQPQPASRVEIIGGISQENFLAVMDTIKAVTSIQSSQSSIQENMIEAAPRSQPNAQPMIEAVPPVPMKRKFDKQMSGVELLDDPEKNEEDSGTASNESGISNESCDTIKAPASS